MLADLPLGRATAKGYFARLARVLEEIDTTAVDRLAAAIRGTRERGGGVYTCGNGGSAATASHLALDLAKNVRRPDRRGLRVFCLADNPGLLTAWANDTTYERIFSAQIETTIASGDLLIAISGSGNSPNVLDAVLTARIAGAETFGVTGMGGGRLAREADDCVVVPSDDMQVVEDAHMAVTHALVVLLRDEP